MSPTSRPAARNLRLALIRLSPLTAGTVACFGVGEDGAEYDSYRLLVAKSAGYSEERTAL
jgi:hypothetical protein